MILESNLENIIPNLNAIFSKFKNGDVVLLQGSVGVGKTSFVIGFVHFLKDSLTTKQSDSFKDPLNHTPPHKLNVNSPSYNIIQEYNFLNQKIYHVDLYRLKNPEDLDSTGFWDLVQDKNSIVFIEWPDMLSEKDFYPRKVHRLVISISNKNLRQYTLS